MPDKNTESDVVEAVDAVDVISDVAVDQIVTCYVK